MVITFKKGSENPKDLVPEGQHVYIIPNLRRKDEARQGDS
jgi:hypothetical protein